jgi:hypothetical protein
MPGLLNNDQEVENCLLQRSFKVHHGADSSLRPEAESVQVLACAPRKLSTLTDMYVSSSHHDEEYCVHIFPDACESEINNILYYMLYHITECYRAFSK